MTILIPAYNECQTIIPILEAVNRQKIDGIKFQILVIDDGSTDGTGELLAARPELYEKLITRPRNGGKGAAVISGLNEATGDYVLFQDADLEYDPDSYGDLFAPVSRFGADLVIGSRFGAVRLRRISSYWHRLGNRAVTWIFNLCNNTTFTDIYSCYLLYRRDLVDVSVLKARGWDQHAEILSIAVTNGESFYEVPITYRGRGYEDGKKIRTHHGLDVIMTILKKRLFR